MRWTTEVLQASLVLVILFGLAALASVISGTHGVF
jgi:hypothetical protein